VVLLVTLDLVFATALRWQQKLLYHRSFAPHRHFLLLLFEHFVARALLDP
jgi:hypothetical protein